MSEGRNWVNIGVGAFIILAVVLLVALILPLSNLTADTEQIAVISINGYITYDGTNSTKIYTSSKELINAINDANSDYNVKAIVLDINSKGGSLAASEEICDLVNNSKKPVVSYIGDKALDESYEIASSSDYIIVSPSSSVGGIGLSYINSKKYSEEPLTGEYDKQYLKLKKENISDSDTLENAQKMLNQDYTQFIKKVAENRNLTPSYISTIASGKKYNGNEAKNLDLVDEVGSKNQAIKKAAKEANVTDYTITSYPKDKSLTERLNDQDIFNFDNLFKSK